MSAVLNGSASLESFERHAEEAARRLAEQGDSMRALIEREERVLEQLRVHSDACTDRLRRLRRATAALSDEPTAKTSTPPAKGKPRWDNWDVSSQKVDQVMAAFVEAGEPRTPTQLARGIPNLSHISVRKAIEILRGQGRLRLVSKTRGGGRLYAVIETPPDAPAIAPGAWTPGGESDG